MDTMLGSDAATHSAKQRLLVTGVGGLLGLPLAMLAAQRFSEVVGTTHSTSIDIPGVRTTPIDLCSPGAIERIIDRHRPDCVINCAAITDLERCEREPAEAYAVNRDAAQALAVVAAARDIRLIHISTDAVFDGSAGPYRETDLPSPVNIYGDSKWEAEQVTLAADPRALVVRTCLFGWSAQGNRSLAEFFVSRLEAGDEVLGYTDAFFSPLATTHLAQLLLRLLGDREQSGLLHLASRDAMSKYQFGRNIARQFGWDAGLVLARERSAAAESTLRGAQLALATDRARDALGEELPSVSEGIGELHRLHVNGHREHLRALEPDPSKKESAHACTDR
ncbi:MAG: sugar nucleotide-binding protein [Acidobacteria bacterium]|nr:sugar nucleotide-binding protein [Acidobacteriota bacterium]